MSITFFNTAQTGWNANPNVSTFNVVRDRVQQDISAAIHSSINTVIYTDFYYTAGGIASSSYQQATSYNYADFCSQLQLMATNFPDPVKAAYSFPGTDPRPFSGGWKIPGALQAVMSNSANYTGLFGAHDTITISSDAGHNWDTTVDGSANTTGGLSLYQAFMHEHTELLGRVSGLTGTVGLPLDLAMWAGGPPGTRNFTYSNAGRFFSWDGGVTNYSSPNSSTFYGSSGGWDAGDFNSHDCFGGSGAGDHTPLTARDYMVLAFIGWPLSATAISAMGLSSPPVNTQAPASTGTPNAGQTITCTPGIWTNSPTLTYQWTLNSTNISGQTGLTTPVLNSQRDGYLACTETATNASGSASKTSNSLGPIIVNTRRFLIH